jgi:hypothetical protein
VRHQLGRHSDDLFAGGQQIAFETARQVPAVFHRPSPLGAELFGPDHQL